VRGVAIGLAVGVLAVGGCSGDDGSPSAATEAEPTAAVPSTSSTAVPSDGAVTIVAINQLHGLFCPATTDACNAPARLDLLWRAIEDAGCPEVVGLAEIGPRQTELVPQRLDRLCDARYALLYDGDAQGENLDQEMILTSLPVRDDAYVELANFPWSGHWAQLGAEFGTIDVLMTHQASSANNPPCDLETCPPICEVGVETGTCHSHEIVAFLEEHAAADSVRVVMGDLNKRIDDPRIEVYTDAGYVDVWELAGLDECDPQTGRNCTCCISNPAQDWDGSGLDDPTLLRDGRIDFVLVDPSRSPCAMQADPTTGVFAGDAVNESDAVDGVYWPSDHAGVITRLVCQSAA